VDETKGPSDERETPQIPRAEYVSDGPVYLARFTFSYSRPSRCWWKVELMRRSEGWTPSLTNDRTS
jgi:hypothetical protein